jgi:hypothetical protein
VCDREYESKRIDTRNKIAALESEYEESAAQIRRKVEQLFEGQVRLWMEAVQEEEQAYTDAKKANKSLQTSLQGLVKTLQERTNDIASANSTISSLNDKIQAAKKTRADEETKTLTLEAAKGKPPPPMFYIENRPTNPQTGHRRRGANAHITPTLNRRDQGRASVANKQLTISARNSTTKVVVFNRCRRSLEKSRTTLTETVRNAQTAAKELALVRAETETHRSALSNESVVLAGDVEKARTDLDKVEGRTKRDEPGVGRIAGTTGTRGGGFTDPGNKQSESRSELRLLNAVIDKARMNRVDAQRGEKASEWSAWRAEQAMQEAEWAAQQAQKSARIARVERDVVHAELASVTEEYQQALEDKKIGEAELGSLLVQIRQAQGPGHGNFPRVPF